jgi:two-component system OmpR family sensor kinase
MTVPAGAGPAATESTANLVAAGLRSRVRRLSLRTRLVAVLLGLLLLSCAALTVITSLALHNYLLGRLDQQLTAAGNRYAVSLEHPGDNAGFDSVVGQQVGTLGARSVNGIVTAAGVVSGDSNTRSVSAADRAILGGLPAGGPRDVHLPGLGEYRVIVSQGQDGDLQLTGLPKHQVDDTIGRLIVIEIMVFLVALVLTGLAGALCVRLSLRPLDRVARTARQVSALPLGSGDVQLPQRLPNSAAETEVGQVTEAFNHMLEHVESGFAERHASEKLLRQFVADASHELRTPIAVIRSHAEYAQLAMSEATEQLSTALERIVGESERMGTLVQDLLLLARLDSGRELARDRVDLTHVVLDSVIDAQAAGRDHDWRLDLPEDEILLSGDANALRQVIINLLANAREHTPAGTTVRVSLSSDTGAGLAILTVSDNGPGIPVALLPHVFQRFVRGDSARGHQGESGLGLSITEAIVHAHSGHIEVTSESGLTRFTVALPLMEPAAARDGGSDTPSFSDHSAGGRD